MIFRHFQKLSVFCNSKAFIRAAKLINLSPKRHNIVPVSSAVSQNRCASKCSKHRHRVGRQLSEPSSSTENACFSNLNQMPRRCTHVRPLLGTRNVLKLTKSYKENSKSIRAFKINSAKSFARNEMKRYDKITYNPRKTSTSSKRSRTLQNSEDAKLKKLLLDIIRTSHKKYQGISLAFLPTLHCNDQIPVITQKRHYTTKKSDSTSSRMPILKIPDLKTQRKDKQDPIGSYYSNDSPEYYYFYRQDKKGTNHCEMEKNHLENPNRVINSDSLPKESLKKVPERIENISKKIVNEIEARNQIKKLLKNLPDIKVEYLKEVITKSIEKISEAEYMKSLAITPGKQLEEEYRKIIGVTDMNKSELVNGKRVITKSEKEKSVIVEYKRRISTKSGGEDSPSKKQLKFKTAPDNKKDANVSNSNTKVKPIQIIVKQKNTKDKHHILTLADVPIQAKSKIVKAPTELKESQNGSLKHVPHINKGKLNIIPMNEIPNEEKKKQKKNKEESKDKIILRKQELVCGPLLPNRRELDLQTSIPKITKSDHTKGEKKLDNVLLKPPKAIKIIVKSPKKELTKKDLSQEKQPNLENILKTEDKALYLENINNDLKYSEQVSKELEAKFSTEEKYINNTLRYIKDDESKIDKYFPSKAKDKDMTLEKQPRQRPITKSKALFDYFPPKPDKNLKSEDDFISENVFNTEDEYMDAYNYFHLAYKKPDDPETIKSMPKNQNLKIKKVISLHIGIRSCKEKYEARKLVSNYNIFKFLNLTTPIINQKKELPINVHKAVFNARNLIIKHEKFISKLPISVRTNKVTYTAKDILINNNLSKFDEYKSVLNIEKIKAQLPVACYKYKQFLSKKDKELYNLSLGKEGESEKQNEFVDTLESCGKTSVRQQKKFLTSLKSDQKLTEIVSDVLDPNIVIESNEIIKDLENDDDDTEICNCSGSSFISKSNDNMDKITNKVQPVLSEEREHFEDLTNANLQKKENKILGTINITLKIHPEINQNFDKPFVLNQQITIKPFQKDETEEQSKKLSEDNEFETSLNDQKSFGTITILLNPSKAQTISKTDLENIKKICKEELKTIYIPLATTKPSSELNLSRQKTNFSQYVENSQKKHVNKNLLEDAENNSYTNNEKPKHILNILDQIWSEVEQEANRIVTGMQEKSHSQKTSQKNYSKTQIYINSKSKQLKSIRDLRRKALKQLEDHFNLNKKLEPMTKESKEATEELVIKSISDSEIFKKIINKNRKNQTPVVSSTGSISNRSKDRNDSKLKTLQVQKIASFSSCGSNGYDGDDPYGRKKEDPYTNKLQPKKRKKLDLRCNMKEGSCQKSPMVAKPKKSNSSSNANGQQIVRNLIQMINKDTVTKKNRSSCKSQANIECRNKSESKSSEPGKKISNLDLPKPACQKQNTDPCTKPKSKSKSSCKIESSNKSQSSPCHAPLPKKSGKLKSESSVKDRSRSRSKDKSKSKPCYAPLPKKGSKSTCRPISPCKSESSVKARSSSRSKGKSKSSLCHAPLPKKDSKSTCRPISPCKSESSVKGRSSSRSKGKSKSSLCHAPLPKKHDKPKSRSCSPCKSESSNKCRRSSRSKYKSKSPHCQAPLPKKDSKSTCRPISPCKSESSDTCKLKSRTKDKSKSSPCQAPLPKKGSKSTCRPNSPYKSESTDKCRSRSRSKGESKSSLCQAPLPKKSSPCKNESSVKGRSRSRSKGESKSTLCQAPLPKRSSRCKNESSVKERSRSRSKSESKSTLCQAPLPKRSSRCKNESSVKERSRSRSKSESKSTLCQAPLPKRSSRCKNESSVKERSRSRSKSESKSTLCQAPLPKRSSRCKNESSVKERSRSRSKSESKSTICQAPLPKRSSRCKNESSVKERSRSRSKSESKSTICQAPLPKRSSRCKNESSVKERSRSRSKSESKSTICQAPLPKRSSRCKNESSVKERSRSRSKSESKSTICQAPLPKKSSRCKNESSVKERSRSRSKSESKSTICQAPLPKRSSRCKNESSVKERSRSRSKSESKSTICQAPIPKRSSRCKNESSVKKRSRSRSKSESKSTICQAPLPKRSSRCKNESSIKGRSRSRSKDKSKSSPCQAPLPKKDDKPKRRSSSPCISELSDKCKLKSRSKDKSKSSVCQASLPKKDSKSTCRSSSPCKSESSEKGRSRSQSKGECKSSKKQICAEAESQEVIKKSPSTPLSTINNIISQAQAAFKTCSETCIKKPKRARSLTPSCKRISCKPSVNTLKKDKCKKPLCYAPLANDCKGQPESKRAKKKRERSQSCNNKPRNQDCIISSSVKCKSQNKCERKSRNKTEKSSSEISLATVKSNTSTRNLSNKNQMDCKSRSCSKTKGKKYKKRKRNSCACKQKKPSLCLKDTGSFDIEQEQDSFTKLCRKKKKRFGDKSCDNENICSALLKKQKEKNVCKEPRKTAVKKGIKHCSKKRKDASSCKKPTTRCKRPTTRCKKNASFHRKPVTPCKGKRSETPCKVSDRKEGKKEDSSKKFCKGPTTKSKVGEIEDPCKIPKNKIKEMAKLKSKKKSGSISVCDKPKKPKPKIKRSPSKKSVNKCCQPNEDKKPPNCCHQGNICISVYIPKEKRKSDSSATEESTRFWEMDDIPCKTGLIQDITIEQRKGASRKRSIKVPIPICGQSPPKKQPCCHKKCASKEKPSTPPECTPGRQISCHEVVIKKKINPVVFDRSAPPPEVKAKKKEVKTEKKIEKSMTKEVKAEKKEAKSIKKVRDFKREIKLPSPTCPSNKKNKTCNPLPINRCPPIKEPYNKSKIGQTKLFSTMSCPLLSNSSLKLSPSVCSYQQIEQYSMKECRSDPNMYTREDVCKIDSPFQPPKIHRFMGFTRTVIGQLKCMDQDQFTATCKCKHEQRKNENFQFKKTLKPITCNDNKNNFFYCEREMSEQEIEQLEETIQTKQCISSCAMKSIPPVPIKSDLESPRYMQILRRIEGSTSKTPCCPTEYKKKPTRSKYLKSDADQTTC